MHPESALDLLVEALEEPVASGQAALAMTIRRLLRATAPELLARMDLEDDHPFLEPLGFVHYATTPDRDPAGVYIGRVALPRIEDLEAELADAVIQPLSACFRDESGQLREVEWPAHDNPADIQEAAHALALAAPRLTTLLRTVARLVVVFRSEELNSFATPMAHGVAFLNARWTTSTAAYVEDLTHQFGHTLLTAAAGDGARYLAVPGNRPLSEITQIAGDGRSVLVALHGIATEALIVGALDACVSADAFRPADEHEALGRLAFVAHRLASDVATLRRPALLTSAGAALMDRIEAVLSGAVERHGARMRSMDLRGQGYNFDAAEFHARNPDAARMAEVDAAD